MLRLRLLLPALVSCIVAQAGASLDLHRGLVEEWDVRQGGEAASLTVEWIDSTGAEGGTTDWTALLTFRKKDTVETDTAVLRFFDLGILLDSGVYRPGRTSAWLRPSCLMPFQRENLDSLLDSLTPWDSFYDSLVKKPYFPFYNRMRSGSIAEFCRGGEGIYNGNSRNTESNTVVVGNESEVCFSQSYHECSDFCRLVPRVRHAPGRGIVAWRSVAFQEEWRMIRFDGRAVEQPSGRLLAKLQPGETWIWVRGGTSDSVWRRMTVRGRHADSAGIPGWDVDVERKDWKGAAVRTTALLRIDTLRGWVALGNENAWPWAPNAPSIETQLAMGFLADGGVGAGDTVILYEDELSPTCMGHPSNYSSVVWTAARGVGMVSIHTFSFDYYLAPANSLWWTLALHSMEPVSVQPRSTEDAHSLSDIRRLCASQPDLRLRRVSLDGRIETGRGAEALRLLERRGVGIFVVGEGREARKIRLLVP